MTDLEFFELHEKCVSAMKSYFDAAEKTSGMLAKCTPEPMPLPMRFELLAQEIAEGQAHEYYLSSKRGLHEMALLGYGAVN